MKPDELIKRRNDLVEEIKTNWNRIYLNNVVPEGKDRHYDVENLYKKIVDDSLLLIGIKIAVQAVNMGLKSIDELPSSSLYPTIYSLQQLKEQKIKLLGMPTDKPNAIFTKEKINELVRDISVEIDNLESMIDVFNSSSEFDIAA